MRCYRNSNLSAPLLRPLCRLPRYPYSNKLVVIEMAMRMITAALLVARRQACQAQAFFPAFGIFPTFQRKPVLQGRERQARVLGAEFCAHGPGAFQVTQHRSAGGTCCEAEDQVLRQR